MNSHTGTASDRDVCAIIIGAGPAGASAAGVLAREMGNTGSILLIERSKWPREKVCGCCLGGAGIELLRQNGLVDDIRALGGEPLHGVELRSASAWLPVRHEGGLAIARDRLDAALVQGAVRHGARFLHGTSARVFPGEGSRWSVKLTSPGGEPRLCEPKLVIVADGLAGTSLDEVPEMRARVARGGFMGVSAVADLGRIGAGAFAPPGFVRMHLGRGGYVGTVRIGHGNAAVAAALDPRLVREGDGPQALMARIVNSCGGGALFPQPPGDDGVRVKGTGMLTRRRERIALPGLLVVGDSAGYVEPFTGEGMTWAIASGVRAAELGAAALLGSAMDRLPSAWEREHARLVQRRQRTCRAVRWLARRPEIVTCAMGVMERIGIAGRCMESLARVVGGEYEMAPPCARRSGPASSGATS